MSKTKMVVKDDQILADLEWIFEEIRGANGDYSAFAFETMPCQKSRALRCHWSTSGKQNPAKGTNGKTIRHLIMYLSKNLIVPAKILENSSILKFLNVLASKMDG